MKNGRAYRRVEFDVSSKLDLEDMLGVDDWTVESSRRNVGQWNETTDYVASRGGDRVLLDSVGKGDRRNWAGMWSAFKEAAR